MAYRVSEAIRGLATVIVAPYEADAQLAWLSRNNHVDFIISEDSDLLVYGCKRVLYKLDFKSERGREIVNSRIFDCPDYSRLSPLSFMITCILAGCDYVDSVASVGIKTAIGIGTKLEPFIGSSMLPRIVDRVSILLKLSGVDVELVSGEFLTSLHKAILTFHYQTVFDSEQQILVPLSDPPLTPIDNAEFLGPMYDNATAVFVANCRVHPDTKVKFSDYVVQPQKVEVVRPKKRPRPTNTQTTVRPCGRKTLSDFWFPIQPHIPKECVEEFVSPIVIDSDDQEDAKSVADNEWKENVQLQHVDISSSLDALIYSGDHQLPPVQLGRSNITDELDKFVFK